MKKPIRPVLTRTDRNALCAESWRKSKPYLGPNSLSPITKPEPKMGLSLNDI